MSIQGNRHKRPKREEVVVFPAEKCSPLVHDLTLHDSATWGQFSRCSFYPESPAPANTMTDNTVIQRAFVGGKRAALILDCLISKKGWIVVTAGIQWPLFLWAHWKNTRGQTIGTCKKYEAKADFFSSPPHFEDTTLVSMPRVLNE